MIFHVWDDIELKLSPTEEALTLRLDALLNRAPLKSKANERLRLGILKQSVLDRLWRFLKDP
ncbi:hypothetical protein, partial [Deinococcus caeni]